MVDSKAIINNSSSNKLFSRNERFQDRHSQRLKEFLRHHNCDGCSGCSLQDLFQQKKAFMLNENEFNITNNNSIASDSQGKKSINVDLIDKILKTTQIIEDKNANNEAKIESHAHGPNCSCSSCAGKSKNIDKLFGSLRKEKIILEDELVKNTLDSSYKNSAIKVHADDCNCDSCISKRENIENLFKKLEVKLESESKADDYINESISKERANLKNLSNKGLEFRSSANYDGSRDSKENYVQYKNSLIISRNVRVNDYYQSSTHVYAVNQKDKFHEISDISNAVTIQKNNENSYSSISDLVNNSQKLEEAKNEKDIFVNNFIYSHQNNAENIVLNQFITNIRKNEIIQQTSSYTLLSN
ncbi:MAG: hypothetical protein QXO21_01715, partial [Candidatus Anstonellales archaeon]